MSEIDIPSLLGLLATAAFAASGILAAMGTRIDLFGALVVERPGPRRATLAKPLALDGQAQKVARDPSNDLADRLKTSKPATLDWQNE